MSPLQLAFFDDHVLVFIWKPWFDLGISDLGPPGHCPHMIFMYTWFAHGLHTVCTCPFSCGFHMAPTWFHVLSTCFAHGLHMVCTWFAHVPHLVFMCFPNGLHMVCTWFFHMFFHMVFMLAHVPHNVFHVVSTWPPHGFHVVSTWFAHGRTCPHLVFPPHGLHVVSTWPPHGFMCCAHGLHMVCTCPPPGFHVFSKWFAHGLHMVFSYGFSHACPYPPQCFLCGFHMAPTGFYVVSIWFAHGLHNLGMDGMDWLDGWDGKHVNYAGVKYIFVTNNVSPATGILWWPCLGIHLEALVWSSDLGFGTTRTLPPHMIFMWFPYGLCMVRTWFAHGLHMVCTWIAHGLQMDCT